MKSVVYSAIFALFLLGQPALAKPNPLSATPDQVKTTLEMLEKLAAKHYASKSVNDTLSDQLLDNYLEKLDPNRIYFLARDVNEFQRWETSLDDALKQGDLSPGFDIFNQYRQRVIERMEKNVAFLEDDPDLNFDSEETLVVDAELREWAESEAELDEIWRKRIKNDYLRLLLAEKEREEIPELLIKRYRNQLKRMEKTDSEDVHQHYMNALASLYDPHTSYYSPRQLENFNISMSLKLEGIGAVLQMEDETTQVVRIIPGGPADQQGILAPEDQIVAVGQEDEEMQDVVGWRLDDVVDKIRGPKGTTVRLEIIPAKGENAGTHREIAIVRDEVKLEEQAARSRILDLNQGGQTYKLGVIELPAFYIDFEAYNNNEPDYKSTTRDVAKLLRELKEQEVDGVILDLRNNGGGSLHEVTTMTDLFINPGPVVQIRNANETISRGLRSRSSPLYEGPLLVLINRLSASASEIFAGAIQDYGRGLVVGTQSFGKGTVQSLVPLHQGQVKLTESKFYRVSGDSTQHRGVIPDIVLPSIYNVEEIGESSQDHALPWDEVHRIPVRKHGNYEGILPTLKELHRERAASDPDYNHLVDELALNEERRERAAVSLNLEERQARRDAYEQALYELENQRRTAKSLPPYDSIETWREEDEIDNGDAAAADESGTDTEEEFPPLSEDPILKEAGHILMDQIRLTDTDRFQVVGNEDQ